MINMCDVLEVQQEIGPTHAPTVKGDQLIIQSWSRSEGLSRYWTPVSHTQVSTPEREKRENPQQSSGGRSHKQPQHWILTYACTQMIFTTALCDLFIYKGAI